jgi:hypothetical protein
MNKKLTLWILFLVFVCVLWFTYKNHSSTSKTYYFDANYITDFTDDKKLAWTSENMFVWKVIKNLWLAPYVENWTRMPNTLFEVEVLLNIKWNLTWTIIVKQEAWYDEEWNLYINKWNEYLERWRVYLLTTLWNSHTIISHPNWSHLITSEQGEDWELLNVIFNNEKVKEFIWAYKNEIYYDENGNKISSEVNAFKDLTQEEKNKIENVINSGFMETLLELQ